MADINEYLSQTAMRGNQNLRPSGVVISYTEEMIAELIKCKQDPIYFISNYIYVVNLDKGLTLMKTYPYQDRMVMAYHNNKRTICLTPRQYGKTISAAAWLVHYILFNDDKTVAVLANKQASADEILHRVRLAYENLPKWMQQGVESWNKRSIELENGSRIFCAATSSSGIRGKSINVLYIDEIGFISNNLAEEFFTSVYPTISSSKESKIIMTSTPNGYNHFYKFWDEAEKGINGFSPVRVHWTEMPGRDQAWYDSQKQVLGELKAAQELDTVFLGSSLTLLTGGTLSTLSADIPIKSFTDQYLGLKIYKYPIKGRNYCMTVDVSRGRHLDYSTFIIFDVTEYPHRIVASYRNNQIAPLMYAAVIHKVATEYNEAYALIEINDIGGQVAEELYYTFEYENMFWTKSGDKAGQHGTDPYPGIRTTKRTKRIGCANLKDIIEKQQLIVNDQDAINELGTFIQSRSGGYEADEGFHDDMVACLWLFAWLVTQSWFSDLFDKSMRNAMYAQIVADMENDMIVGERSDGLEDFVGETPEQAGLTANWW